FVITLGMMVLARGLALILSNGTTIAPMGSSFESFGSGYMDTTLSAIILGLIALGLIVRYRRNLFDAVFPVATFAFVSYAFLSYKGLPYLVLVMAVVLAASAIVLTQTTFGRCVYAIGSNEQAAHWAGVPVRKVKFLVHAVMGAFAGVAA